MSLMDDIEQLKHSLSRLLLADRLSEVKEALASTFEKEAEVAFDLRMEDQYCEWNQIAKRIRAL